MFLLTVGCLLAAGTNFAGLPPNVLFVILILINVGTLWTMHPAHTASGHATPQHRYFFMKDTSWREAIGSRELAENVACRTRAQTAAYRKFLEERECSLKRFLKTCP